MIDLRDIELVTLAQLPKFQRRILLAAYLLVLLLLGYGVFLYPQLARLDSQRVKEKEQLSIILSKSHNVAYLEQRKSKLESLRERNRQLQTQVLQPMELTRALSDLHRIAEQHGLVFPSIVRGSPTQVDSYPQHSLQFELTGRYRQISAFFKSTSTLSYPVHFDVLHWRRAQAGSNRLHVKGHIYLFQSSEEVSDAN
ncbi:type 4a pilus biogenesis protein PilO [Vibrio coralliilyticus]|uniref:type 4a pilus biogenesis protein PilO n=1 Tax=Vibrio coralliilyticus TaxID=190893 RepID=UPI00155FFA58|nr:type 4a pilus biogenesis protein PilO [Vibrio coralliilyticus]NRF27849.1 type 4a pilus biogenesis protein PilO [Vibrio coralliilyticus]NRF81999.1 type 4a pilus biogenesis protein PilO [Vibrio coralliilyticus]